MGFDKFEQKRRKSVAKSAAKAVRGSRGGGGGGFGNRFALPCSDEEPAEVMLFPGNYETKIVPAGSKKAITEINDYCITMEHFYPPKKRGFTCSAGLQYIKDSNGDEIISTGKDPCTGCLAKTDGLIKDSFRTRLVCTFNLVRFGHFHQVDGKNKNREGVPYKDWTECEGRHCKRCKKGLDRTYGRRMYWPLGKGYLNDLIIRENNFSKNCRCGGKIFPIAFACSNIKCQEPYVDLEEDPMSRKELKEYRQKVVACDQCDNEDLPEELLECSECDKPEPLTLFDVVLTVASSETSDERAEQRSTGKRTGSPPKLQILESRVVTERDLRKVEKLLRPFDLYGKIYKINSLDEQAEKLGIVNPYDDEEEEDRPKRRRSKKAVDWKSKDSDNDDDDEDEDDE